MTSTLKRAWQLTPVFLPGEPPWTEEPGGLQSIGFQRVGHDWSDLAHTHVRSRRMSREVAQMCPTVAYQAPPSMEFSRQEYWSGLPFPSPGRSSWSRDGTQVSCIAGRFFTVLSHQGGPLYKDIDPKSSFIDDRKDFFKGIFCLSSWL